MPTISPPLDWHKAQALDQVNTEVGAARRAFATETSFQSQAYLNKRQEAKAYLETTPATLDDFPLLKELTVVRGMSAADLAQLWLDTNDDWTPVLNQTEIIRDKAVFAIKAATTRAEIEQTLTDFQSEITAMQSAQPSEV